MSLATFKRDLEYMRERFNAPIEYDREAKGYRLGEQGAGPRYELPGLWFNAAEVLALLAWALPLRRRGVPELFAALAIGLSLAAGVGIEKKMIST